MYSREHPGTEFRLVVYLRNPDTRLISYGKCIEFMHSAILEDIPAMYDFNGRHLQVQGDKLKCCINQIVSINVISTRARLDFTGIHKVLVQEYPLVFDLKRVRKVNMFYHLYGYREFIDEDFGSLVQNVAIRSKLLLFYYFGLFEEADFKPSKNSGINELFAKYERFAARKENNNNQ